MQIRQIEAFRAVMTSGGITAAAAMLNISQPSVSRLIADLERVVGFDLFERRGRRLVPTEQANSFYEAVHQSFTGVELLKQAARRIRAHPVGTIRIAALSALAGGILPTVMARFHALYPDVKVTVESQGQHGVEDRVFLGQADLGLGVNAPPRQGLRTSPLVPAEYVCVLPPDHPLGAKRVIHAGDLAGQRFIGPMHEADALWDDIDRMLVAEGVVVDRLIETQHSFPAYCYVTAGLGVTIAEPFSALLFARLGAQIRRFRPRIASTFTLLEATSIGPTPGLVAQFRQIIQDVATEHMAAVERLANPTGGPVD
ncbi:MAG: LysR substrate-binding domain-containing protein [Azospirillaceae bacterium]|nr:LysR substrate-binding domain-containing protein [Azospirillaceae bacterium]